MFEHAAIHGDVLMLKTLYTLCHHDRRYGPWDPDATYDDDAWSPDRILHLASTRGNINIVDWMLGQGYYSREMYIENACMHGHLDLLKYFVYYQECTPLSGCTYWAFRNRHYDCAAFAIQNGFPLFDELKPIGHKIAHLHGRCQLLAGLDPDSDKYKEIVEDLEGPVRFEDRLRDKIFVALLKRMEL